MNTRITSLQRTAALMAALLAVHTAPAQSIIVDHTCATLEGVPASAIQHARETLHVAYGHTSHGSQLIDGMRGLVDFMNPRDADAFADGAFAFNSGGTGGALDLRDTPFSGASDLGNPNRTAWATATRNYLAAHPEVNVIIWSWCGQVDGSAADINTYLSLMSDLEDDYPGVRFVYMTGHLNGTGAAGNVNVRNNQIREYCRANGKVLYDFADIESYDPDGSVNYMELLADDNCDYDSDGNGSRDRNWATAWQAMHAENVDWYSCPAAHSQALNGNRKAYAAWQLWARLAGWSGHESDATAPGVPIGVHATATRCTRVELAWTASTDAESGVSCYRLYRDGELIGQSVQASFTDTEVAPSTGYVYAVVAVNGAGLVSAASAALEVTTPADSTPPSAPAGLTLDAINSRSIALSWTASTDDVGVTGYTILRDGAAVATVAEGGWTDSELMAGRTYQYAVSAHDAAGNASAPCSVVAMATTPDPIVPGVRAPATLSASGFFTDLGALTAASGLVPYEVVQPGWNDYALVRRWVRRASETAQFGFSADESWTAPEGTVWVQQLDRETVCGDSGSRIHVETRVLLRTGDGVYGLSYRWNDAQTDADLVAEEGAVRDLAVCDGSTSATQPWTFPARSTCLECHQASAGYALGFNTRQLNRAGADGSGTANQITAWAAADMFEVAPPAVSTLPVHPRLVDTNVPLEWRARAWLDANCAACHRPGGAAGTAFDLRASTSLSQTGLVGGAVADRLGDPAMCLLAPGYPEHSAVAVRVHRAGAGQMPAAGRSMVDPLGARVVTEWIHRLALSASAREGRIDNLSTRGVVQVGASVMIGGFVVSGAERRQILLRGVGPGLEDLGVSGVLTDVRIDLFRGESLLGSNDDWHTSADADAIRAAARECGAFDLTEGGRDAALLMNLEPGSYTVHLTGGAGANAIGMFEAYDITASGGSRMVNMSTRLQLGRGDRVAIPGLVVGGDTRRTFLIRAVGPGLAAFDLEGLLDNPRVSLMSEGSAPFVNDDWWSDEAAAIALAGSEVGAFPLEAGSRDAALLVTLDPGIYTVVTDGDSDAEGLVLVEVYEAL